MCDIGNKSLKYFFVMYLKHAIELTLLCFLLAHNLKYILVMLCELWIFWSFIWLFEVFNVEGWLIDYDTFSVKVLDFFFFASWYLWTCNDVKISYDRAHNCTVMMFDWSTMRQPDLWFLLLNYCMLHAILGVSQFWHFHHYCSVEWL
jgi:hypothetical protein